MKNSLQKEQTFSFTSTLERSNNKLWGRHITVPVSVKSSLINGKSRRVVCTLNDSVEKQCAVLPYGNGKWVIAVNSDIQKQLGLKIGMEVRVSLRRDNSAYGLPMAGELRELLRQDKEGNRLIHALSPGRLRTLLYIVNKAKSTDERIERSLTIVRHLKSNKGQINYRRLSEQLKKSSVL